MTSASDPRAAPGEPFPKLALRTSRDRPVEFVPRSAVVVFYRGHWCGHCREQLSSLAAEASAFRAAEVDVFAISSDDFVGANDMRLDTRDAITILSDPDAAAIEFLGLQDRDDSVEHVIARPAVYLIDGDGIVRYRYIGRSMNDRPTTALIALAAESLSRPRRKESSC